MCVFLRQIMGIALIFLHTDFTDLHKFKTWNIIASEVCVFSPANHTDCADSFLHSFYIIKN